MRVEMQLAKLFNKITCVYISELDEAPYLENHYEFSYFIATKLHKFLGGGKTGYDGTD